MAADPGKRKDPLPVFCFHVALQDIDGEVFFKSVSGLRWETEMIPVKAGGQNFTTFQLVGSTKWSNIVLKQGFTKGSGLLAWRKRWMERTGERKFGTITQLDTALNKKAAWTFHRGVPVKWEISEFDASKSELAIETLEIAHEGLTYEALGGAD
jgi:phage tail-like protein